MLCLLALQAACGPIPEVSHNATPPPDAGPLPDGVFSSSNIRHVVVIVQENHTFDAYFGRYCTAKPGSAPSCTDGPSCCEAAPAVDPSGASPVSLDDCENAVYDPDHTQGCELAEMNGGRMDRYVRGAGCSNGKNFALAAPEAVKTYTDLATANALADRYFQPVAGSTSSNDMYFAGARYVFTDNQEKPDSAGKDCTLPAQVARLVGFTTIADVLLAHGASFAFYAEGYDAMRAALPGCPPPPPACPLAVPTTPCDYDPSDVPFQYYEQFADDPVYMRDTDRLAPNIADGILPNVSFVKAVGYKNEHPGYSTTISLGETFVQEVVDEIEASPYASDTLILVTWDEGGGFFDHVAPPGPVSPGSQVDGVPYGTRVPLLAIGPFARKGTVSHVTMEHSSIVKFLEWNFTGATGQLRGRDAVVNNLGSLLDPTATGAVVPVN